MSIEINDIVPLDQFIATSLQTVFDVSWTADATTDIVVYARASGAAASDINDLIDAADYTATLVGGTLAIRVTFAVGRTLDDVVTITRDTPAVRDNLYINTNFTPSMLNSDFARSTLIEQQNEMFHTSIGPRYNTSETLLPTAGDNLGNIDRILPLLGASEVWVKNSGNTAIVTAAFPSGGAAPQTATYITQTSDPQLDNEQALGALPSGFLASTTTTGVVAARTLTGTANSVDIANGDGSSAPVFSISADPTLPGNIGVQIPSGTTAQRVTPISPAINFRYNTDNTSVEYYDHGVPAWVSMSTNTIGSTFNSVQWNNAGAFDGTAAFTTDGSNVAITGSLDVDNIKIDGNSITSTDAAGDINLTPDTTGDLVLDGIKWPQADGTLNQIIVTNGAGQLSFTPDLALDSQLYFTGIIAEKADVSISSDGITITLSIEKDGGGNLNVLFSTGKYDWTTAPDTVALTAGTDSAPILNYIFLLESTKTLTANTTGFPDAEYAPVAEVYCQSAALLQTDGAYLFHQWTNDIADENNNGHNTHLNTWIRHQPATWLSGVNLTPTTGIATFDIATALGYVLELHEHEMPAFDTSAASWVYVPNDSVSSFVKVTDLTTILTDANGSTLSNRRFNLVVWGAVSQDSNDCQLYVNLPTASYNNDQNTIDDTDRTSVYNIPISFRGAGFLIARLSVRHVSSSGTWSILQNEDLRGIFPSVATGSGTGGIDALLDDPNPTLANDLDMSTFGLKDANGNALIDFTATGSAVNELHVANAATGTAVVVSTTGDDANPDLAIMPKGSGGVGIGTTTPAATLDVNGGVNSNGQLRLGTTNWPTTYIGDSAGRHIINGTTEPFLIMWNEATPGIGNNSNVILSAKSGAGANTFGGIKFIAGTENATDAKGFLNVQITDATGNLNSVLYVDSDENVGLGTTTPGAKLDVNGAIHATSISFNAGADVLDQYEESGSWTVVLSDASVGGNTATATTSGVFTRLGNQVSWNFTATSIDTTGMTAGNALIVQGLPFTAGETNQQYISSVKTSDLVFTENLNGVLVQGNDFLRLTNSRSGTTTTNVLVSNLTSGSAQIFMSGVYFV